jgi:hypothetical protein
VNRPRAPRFPVATRRPSWPAFNRKPGSLIGGGIVKPADAQAAGMAGTDRAASPVGGGAGGAAIGRDVADRQRLAAVFNGGGDGF